MHRRDLLLSALAAAPGLTAARLALAADEKPAADKRLYEFRNYTVAVGRLEDLHAVLRDPGLKVAAKHGVTPIGIWTPKDNAANTLLVLTAFPDAEAREKALRDLEEDPDLRKAIETLDAKGAPIEKMDTFLLKATDYSPAIKPDKPGKRVFELRHYTAAPGKLDALQARFRDHTVRLFKKHGMSNLGYWSPAPGEKGADTTLIYILAHASVDAAKASFAAFGQDPEWQAARKESEQKAGGPLTAPGGVRSFFMDATDYSPWR